MLKKLLSLLAACCAATAFAAVDVNTATAEDLNSVKGIGAAMSARIIEARKDGNFKDWNDLKARVKGIGNKKAGKLSDEGLTVDGASYDASAAKAQKNTGKKAAKKAGKKAAKKAAAAAAD